jgi:hypothetical protein
LLWASPFIPEYKRLVTPLESLLSGSSTGEWTVECTEVVNKLTEMMYQQIKLVQGDPSGVFEVYSSVRGEIGLVVMAQV